MKQKKWMAPVMGTALVLSLILTACGGSSGSAVPMSESAVTPMEPQEKGMMDTAEMDAMAGGGSYHTADSIIYQSETAKVIRRAQLTLQTTEFDGAVSALASHTETYGGYYEESRVDSGSFYYAKTGRSAYFVIRVPKEHFVPFRDGMAGIGHLSSIQESTEDVGEVYYDTEARLATLTTKRERLLSLLEQAELMEDIIALEDALAEVQHQIDQNTTSLRKYDSLIGYSTFTVYLEEVARVREEPGLEDSFMTRLVDSLGEGLHEFGQTVQAVILWLARNLIGIAIAGAVLAAIVVVGRKKLQWGKRKTEPATREPSDSDNS